jgi:hypothetical protein
MCFYVQWTAKIGACLGGGGTPLMSSSNLKFKRFYMLSNFWTAGDCDFPPQQQAEYYPYKPCQTFVDCRTSAPAGGFPGLKDDRLSRWE